MVSSELVVLLIVCVGINTGSAQQREYTSYIIIVNLLTRISHTEYCHGGQIDDSVCNYVTTDNTSSCVSATLQCENMMCTAVISGSSRTCHFTAYYDAVISQHIQCCFCNDSYTIIPIPWWDCAIEVTAVTSSLPSPSPLLPSQPPVPSGE